MTTTEIYTHVSIVKLQKIYRATHPAELPTPRDGPEDPPPLPEDAARALLAADPDPDPDDEDLDDDPEA